MNSIRTKRLMSELKNCSNDKSDDLRLDLISQSDLSRLVGSFVAFENTPYEGGCYKIDLEFPDNFPFQPPKARFITKVWHPNISSASGCICLDLLRAEKWAPGIAIKNVLTSIKTLLIIAQPDDPQDAVVANQYMNNFKLFEKTASYWNHIYAGGPFKPYFTEMSEKVQLYQLNGYSFDEAIHTLSINNWETFEK